MTVLHLDPCMPGNVPLAEAPAMFVLGQWGEYAHMPRSRSDGAYGELVQLWCGQSAATTRQRGFRWSDTPGGRPICGTCVGRRLGYDTGVVDVAFRPTRTLNDLSRRRWCPGRTLDLIVEHGRDATCLLCGFEGRMHGGGNAFNPSWQIEPHAPASPTALVHCPSCGFRHLRSDGRRVWCRAWRCDFTTEVRP